MIRKILSILIIVSPILCFGRAVKSYTTSKSGIKIVMEGGTLEIKSLSDNALRVQFYSGDKPDIPELILTSDEAAAPVVIDDLGGKLKISTSKIVAILDKKTGKLTYTDSSGRSFLQENGQARKLVPTTIGDEKCFVAEQGFVSPSDERIFGLGQFQDGHYNLKNVTRRLTQVNSQIAIPIIYSSSGYGLLWHQYGITDFNPADNFIALEKEQQSVGDDKFMEVTTTLGTQKVSQNQSLYSGTLAIPKDGEYSLFLDLGDMGNRHFVTIDGEPCIDQSNMWLPPTVGTNVKLTKGSHKVQIICKSDNNPTLSWRACDNNTTFRSTAAKMIDYVIFYGPSADEVIASYRKLSGEAPMFPKWAYGFWQCRERYTSGQELVETVKEFHRRELPLDVIVQDWQYWGNNGWGVPQFDEKNYPNPAQFISELHSLNAHFNISIWSNPDKNSTIGREYVAKNRFIPNTKWLDYFNPETRKEYWNTLNSNMFSKGVDSWWMDAVEPENDALKGETTFIGKGDFYRLTYPLMVSQAVYEGQREATSDKRVTILTRSAFPGQQRYGVINWSGDIGGTWDDYARQIVAGLNFTITGFPYWTTDIGGFFRPGRSQYSDPAYHEILTRWFQWGAFNPIFRVHGYQSETEPWKYGEKVEENMRKALQLRYRLLPYIYSEAWQVTNSGSTMMRPLIMDFGGDTKAVDSRYQFMFGKSILVSPITTAGVTQTDVYLPKGVAWYDFWTGSRFDGGQSVKTDAPLDKIPLYVRAGSIIPMGPIVQYAAEKEGDPLEIRVYKGADGRFELYEDEGDNYNYESGKHTITTFVWNDKLRTLTIEDRKGDYKNAPTKRVFNVVLVEQQQGAGLATTPSAIEVKYSGTQVVTGF